MTEGSAASPEDAIASVVESARQLGVDIDADEAAAWITSITTESGGSLVVDVNTGVYGHRVTMADVDEASMARFRRMAEIVGVPDRPPDVLTALAIAGSAAQGKVHRFPADCDFFERIHIRADTRDAACATLADVMRAKALDTLRGPGYRLFEVKFGNWPADLHADGTLHKAGSPISWTPAQIEAGAIAATAADGTPTAVSWTDASANPGWCKLDWVVVDPENQRLSNASNMLDVTWEAPDGVITPLDGFLDPYFQEVYLETDSIPLFSRLVKEMGADSVAEYVEALTGEVVKYTVKESNHGKAARRLYNIFRLTGRYAEAAYIRELFDEPVTALYQVAALLRTLQDAATDPGSFDAEGIASQVDDLIMSAVSALDGPAEADMVRQLLRVREAFSQRAEQATYAADIDDVQADAMQAVDAYFKRALHAVPGIHQYLEELAAAAH